LHIRTPVSRSYSLSLYLLFSSVLFLTRNEAGTEASPVSKVKRGVSHSDVTKLRYIF